MTYIYDTETYPNCFLLCATCVETGIKHTFELSHRRNDMVALRDWINSLAREQSVMVGFNNVGFDYPVLHFILTSGIGDPAVIYQKAMMILQSEDKFTHTVRPSDCWVKQVDLFKIHHFDNKARMTSLKALEFNMHLANISDLPFPVGTMLTPTQMDTLTTYCWNDVEATQAFYELSLGKIKFRNELSAKYQQDFTNYNDTKIGAEIFRISLEAANIPCYNYDSANGRTPRQTVRNSIRLADCIPSYIRFHSTEFERVRTYLCNQTITETKGVFKDLSATVAGLEYVFGTGGIHASVSNESFVADDKMMILDVDVTSMYPSIAISNRYYPEHLTPKFVDVYQQLKDQRVGYKKGTPENDMLKLALNGVYGKSNDKFSIFYDPKVTMQITLTGQLCLAMLAERLTPYGKIIQANTDGITLYIPRHMLEAVRTTYQQWEQEVGLTLEEAEYSKMFIADVNSYLAVKTNGQVKRKGRYEYDLDWHQDASALVVPKVAEKVLVDGAPLRETVEGWPDFADFLCRVKVPRSSRLETSAGKQLENTQRYYLAKNGVELVKIMPPLKGKTEWRRFAVQKGYKVCPCNNILDATLPIDFDWYVTEVEKLVLGVL